MEKSYCTLEYYFGNQYCIEEFHVQAPSRKVYEDTRAHANQLLVAHPNLSLTNAEIVIPTYTAPRVICSGRFICTERQKVVVLSLSSNPVMTF